MENIDLPEDMSAVDRARLEAVVDALVTILTPLCKAIVDEYLSKLDVSMDPRNESRRKSPGGHIAQTPSVGTDPGFSSSRAAPRLVHQAFAVTKDFWYHAQRFSSCA